MVSLDDLRRLKEAADALCAAINTAAHEGVFEREHHVAGTLREASYDLADTTRVVLKRYLEERQPASAEEPVELRLGDEDSAWSERPEHDLEPNLRSPEEQERRAQQRAARRKGMA